MPTIILQSPGAVICKLGSLSIRWYSICYAVGFLSANYFAGKLAQRYKIESEKLTNLMLLAFIAGILGGRLYYVALKWNEFALNPQDILATWKGGMSIHGGIIGGFIAGCLYAKYAGLPKRQVADIIAAVLPLGQAIGRWGNFFNSEAFGGPIPPGFPLAVFIPVNERPPSFASSELFHATFLYESIWDFGIFALIYCYLSRVLKRVPGVCFLIYLALYNIGRLLIEPLRSDSIMAGQVPVPIIASAVQLLIAVVLVPVLVNYAKAHPAANDEPALDSDSSEGAGNKAT